MNWLFKKNKLTNLRQIVNTSIWYYAIALGGGILMGLAPAPLNLWLLSWVALAPLWVLIFQQKISYQKVAILGASWGFGYHGLALFWITGVHPMTWMGVPWLASLLIAVVVWLVISFWGAFFVALWSCCFSLAVRKLVKLDRNQLLLNIFLKVLIGVTIWCSLETLWSYEALWWSSLSYTQSPSNLIILQFAKVSGFNTVTAAIVLVNGLLAEAIISNKLALQRNIAIATGYQKTINRYDSAINQKTNIVVFALPLAVFIALHLYGWRLYSDPVNQDNLQPIKVGIIQGNIPNEIKLYSQGWQKAIQGYTTGYQKLAQQKVDVVLTPETALPFYWNNITNNSDFYRAVVNKKIPAWVGAYGKEDKSYTNSLFTLTGTGKTFSRYDKTILVPLGEYIPFEPIIGKIIDRLSPLEAHLQAGKSRQIFDTPFGRAIVGICYESAFSQHFLAQAKAGGEFIITASNNAHYSKAMPAQHHAQDVIRAIESDRWAARATNTGYSAIVDPQGKTIWKSDINRYQLYAGTIYRRKTKTLYVQWGDWLTKVLVVISIIVVLII